MGVTDEGGWDANILGSLEGQCEVVDLEGRSMAE